MRLFTGFVLSILMMSAAFADTIELINGKKMEGSFVGREGDAIKFDVDGISMTFNAADVKNISMGSAAKTSSDTKNEAKSETVAKTGDADKKSTVPAGTTLVIRIGETLNPSKNAEGHKFTAKLESAVVIDGVTIVPVDSNVYGVVLEAKKSRRLAGQASIKLGITDIRINGQMHKIKTTALTGVGEQTAKKTAGQTAKWAAVGGLADGSSGAKTGAKVGLGAAILTGGNQAEIKAGTLLEFSLTEAVNL